MKFMPCALATAALLSACAVPAPHSPPTAMASAPASTTAADAHASDCRDGERITVGPYIYENNMWGANKARGFTPQQCLQRRERDGKTELGWRWNWPGFDPSVFGYPQIIWGWKPWSGGPPTDARFPRKLADLRALSIRYEVETEARGSYNLAPEVWLTRSGAWSQAPNPRLITAEVMFWVDAKESSRPAGRVVDRFTLDGAAWELWRADNAGDKGDGTGWTLLSLKRATPLLAGTLDLKLLLDRLAATGHLDPQHHVASVEFGNEVVGGSGSTWVRHFEVRAEP